MKRWCRLAAALLLVCGSCSRSADTAAGDTPLPPVTVSASADPTRATVSEEITFTLKAVYDKGLTISMPEIGTQLAGLRIVDFGEDGPREIDTRLEHSRWYRLRADISGTYIIPSHTVTVTHAGGSTQEIQTPQIFLEIASSGSKEDPAMTDIHDIKPLHKARRNLRPAILWGSVGIALAGLAAGIRMYLKRRSAARLTPPRPAHEVALEEIAQLKKDDLVGRGIVSEHYFRLSDIFRRYLENRFHIPAVEQTTQELLPVLTTVDGIDRESRNISRTFLLHSDLIKFARLVPSAEEVDSSYEQVVAVIDKTKQEPQPEKAAKTAVTRQAG